MSTRPEGTWYKFSIGSNMVPFISVVKDKLLLFFFYINNNHIIICYTHNSSVISHNYYLLLRRISLNRLVNVSITVWKHDGMMLKVLGLLRYLLHVIFFHLYFFTVALAMMNTDSWLASDTSGSVFMSALIRASGSLDSRLWVAAAAGPVCCWLLSSSASAPRPSSSLPHLSGSCSVGVTGVATVAAILCFSFLFLHKRCFQKNPTQITTVF